MILSGLSLWEKGSPLHKSTQQVRTQGPIRHADCRQRKLADFLCTGGIIQEMLGAQYLSIRNSNNETLLRRKIGILPADFSIEIKGGMHANEGTIVITTQHPCVAKLKDKTLEATRKRTEGRTEIQLKAEGVPPAFITLQVLPNLAADPIDIELPFPAKGCLALDVNGRPLDKN